MINDYGRCNDKNGVDILSAQLRKLKMFKCKDIRARDI